MIKHIQPDDQFSHHWCFIESKFIKSKMQQRSSFSPSRKIDFKSSFINSPDQSFSNLNSGNLSERCKFENKFENMRHSAAAASSSKFVSSKSSFMNKNDTSSLTNLNALANSNHNFKSSLSNSSNFNSNSSLPQSPTIEEPFSPRIENEDDFLNGLDNSTSNYSTGSSKKSKSPNIFYNNANNNIKHVTSYSISSTGSKTNNKICQINSKISNRILNRNSSLSENNNSLISTTTLVDPIDLQFNALYMAAKSANFENREHNESPNPIVANAFTKIGTKMTNLVEQYKDNLDQNAEQKTVKQIDQEINILNEMYYLLSKSQSIPYYGIDLINNLGKILCNLGALDHIIKNFTIKTDSNNHQNVQQMKKKSITEISEANESTDLNNNKLANNLVSSNESLCEKKDASHLETTSTVNNNLKQDKQKELEFSSAKLLNNCLTKENTAHLIQNNYQNLPNLVYFCCSLADKRENVENEQIGTGILRNLLEYNEDICKEILIKLNAIETILYEAKTADIQTLRNCVHCLANVVLFGGDECQTKLVEKSLLIWLFPLASHSDLQIKYFALMTLVILVANKEIEGAVLKSGSLDLVDPFILSNSPQEFATFRGKVSIDRN